CRRHHQTMEGHAVSMKPTRSAAAGTTQARPCSARLHVETKASPSPARCDVCTIGFTKDYVRSQSPAARQDDPRGAMLLRLPPVRARERAWPLHAHTRAACA